MLERPNHGNGQSVDFADSDCVLVKEPYSERAEKAEPNQNFVKSIQELQLFFEKYDGTHSER